MAPTESAHEGKYLGQKWLLTQSMRSKDGHCFPWTPFRQDRKEKDIPLPKKPYFSKRQLICTTLWGDLISNHSPQMLGDFEKAKSLVCAPRKKRALARG